MQKTIIFLGNPNSGKSTLFNCLTGSNSKVGNYPGATVEAKYGSFQGVSGDTFSVVDLPGVYSLIPASDDERIATKFVLDNLNDLFVLVIDVNELKRGLYLYSQLIELGCKTLIALNLTELDSVSRGKEVKKIITQATGAYIALIDYSQPKTIETLKNLITGISQSSFVTRLKSHELLGEQMDFTLRQKISRPELLEFFQIKSFDNEVVLNNLYVFLANLWHKKVFSFDYNLTKEEKKTLESLLFQLPEERFGRIERWLEKLGSGHSRSRIRSDRIDKILLSPIFGPVVLVGIFALVLQATFEIASPICDFIGNVFANASLFVSSFLGPSLVQSVLADGIIAGLGTILSFTPLIALLFFILAVLEESGYMARVGFILDKRLGYLGLSGRSVIPMISGFACAIPAITAAKTIPSKKQKLITIMAIPFISCSARIPVYVLITTAVFSGYGKLWGIFDISALAFIFLYSLGIVFTLLFSFLLSKGIKSVPQDSFSIDLPILRLPKMKIVGKKVFEKVYSFVTDAGGIILAASILMWALFNVNFSWNDNQVIKLSHGNMEQTAGGKLGELVEPMFRPIGIDGKIGTAILAGFLAREVFVSSVAIVYKAKEDEGLMKEKLKMALPLPSALSLLVFFALSLQCFSTVIVTKRETNSVFWAFFQFFFMTGSAYLASFLTFNIVHYLVAYSH